MEKGGWVQKNSRTGHFGEENWEGGGPPFKPVYIYILYRMSQSGSARDYAYSHVIAGS
jgi:hypothetical protein